MDTIMINVKEIINKDICVASSDGQKVFDEIVKAFCNEQKVTLSFAGIELITSSFLNTAVGQLYKDFKTPYIRSKIILDGMSNEDKALLKRVNNNAKLFYKDPKGSKDSITEIIEE